MANTWKLKNLKNRLEGHNATAGIAGKSYVRSKEIFASAGEAREKWAKDTKQSWEVNK